MNLLRRYYTMKKQTANENACANRTNVNQDLTVANAMANANANAAAGQPERGENDQDK